MNPDRRINGRIFAFGVRHAECRSVASSNRREMWKNGSAIPRDERNTVLFYERVLKIEGPVVVEGHLQSMHSGLRHSP